MTVFSKYAVAGSVVAGLMTLSAAPASAGLIFDSTILLTGEGFGTAPRDLSVERNGNVTSPESGCVSVLGNVFSVGTSACMGTDAHMGNTVINVGGDEPNPQADNQKYGAPLASALGINSAADIGILFNATEPAGDRIMVDDITLKFFLDGVLIGSIDGSQEFLSSLQGTGSAGFVFRVDDAQQAYVNGLLAQGDIRFALEATLSDSSGGSETFLLVNLNGTNTVPEPTSLVLFGLGAIGAGMRLRRKP